jgi:hypothetical protein
VNIDFETPLEALLTHWRSTAILPFTANATAGSAVLTNVSSFSGLFTGLPVVGPGVVKGATIASFDALAGTVTLSDPVGAAATAGAFSAGFQTLGRRLQHWQKVTAQPALFLRRIGATDEDANQGGFIITTLECQAWIYCDAGKNPDLAPDTGLTALERLLRQTVAPDDPGGDPRFTIGGQVYWCRVEGRTDSSSGDQAGQAIARIPLRITLP